MSIQLRSLDLPIHGHKKSIGEIEASLHAFIEVALRENVLSLIDLMQISEVEFDQLMEIQSPEMPFSEDESRALAVEEVVQNRVFEIRNTQTTLSDLVVVKPQETEGTAELIRDGEIRECFLNTLKSAKKRVLIVSPWMTEQAVDNELVQIFNELAAKRVVTLLGWGISRAIEDEKSPPSERLLKKLAQIKTPEGLPAAVVVWLGNQHSKDVIVDHAVHLCGSHNWLSYRGDYLPRGESTYRITFPEPVEQAAGHIEQLFVDSVRSQSEGLLADNGTVSELIQCISIWIGSGQFVEAGDYAVNTIQEAIPAGADALSTLCLAASERLYGATPETRAALLISMGRIWSVQDGDSVTGLFSTITATQRTALSKSIQKLMQKLAEQDPVRIQQIIEDFYPIWQQLDISDLKSSE